MSLLRNCRIFGVLLFLLLFSATFPLYGQDEQASSDSAVSAATVPSGPPDATLFATYTLNSADTTVSWIVCGSTALSSGCYGSGSLGPFGKVGSLIEGSPFVIPRTTTVTRAIYVVDVAAGASANGVVLNVYKKTDMVTSSFDTVTVTLTKTIPLPLIGGINAQCFMAANNDFLYIGTDQSQQAVRLHKGDLTLTQVGGGFSPPVNVSAITVDKYGYVTVTQGSLTAGTGFPAFTVFGPNGSRQEDGGGANFMLNTTTGVSPSSLPKSSAGLAPRLEVKPKTDPQ